MSLQEGVGDTHKDPSPRQDSPGSETRLEFPESTRARGAGKGHPEGAKSSTPRVEDVPENKDPFLQQTDGKKKEEGDQDSPGVLGLFL